MLVTPGLTHVRENHCPSDGNFSVILRTGCSFYFLMNIQTKKHKSKTLDLGLEIDCELEVEKTAVRGQMKSQGPPEV